MAVSLGPSKRKLLLLMWKGADLSHKTDRTLVFLLLHEFKITLVAKVLHIKAIHRRHFVMQMLFRKG